MAIDHPWVLIASLLLGLPCFVALAMIIFRHSDEEPEANALCVPAVSFDSLLSCWLVMKVVVFFLACLSVGVTLYKVGVWVVSFAT